ncbi:DUF5572 domain-containing protein [Aspergillus stella-maris]|uniref:DUF5572 domain-containing protein n=1 Tax=Aspergillus stella-maris TaxID=1810926 RepID=UPI003CCD44D2
MPMNPATITDTSAPPTQGDAGTAQATSGSQHTQAEIFERIATYPFTSDPEFSAGLATILGHPTTPASREEINRNDDLVLQAKCYYFNRKEKLSQPLDVTAYSTWLEAKHFTCASVVGPCDSNSSAKTSPSSGNAEPRSNTVGSEPAYPTSFAHIVELITTGQPVPGIQEIPDTLLMGQGAASAKPRRLKPWEREVTD